MSRRKEEIAIYFRRLNEIVSDIDPFNDDPHDIEEMLKYLLQKLEEFKRYLGGETGGTLEEWLIIRIGWLIRDLEEYQRTLPDDNELYYAIFDAVHALDDVRSLIRKQVRK